MARQHKRTGRSEKTLNRHDTELRMTSMRLGRAHREWIRRKAESVRKYYGFPVGNPDIVRKLIDALIASGDDGSRPTFGFVLSQEGTPSPATVPPAAEAAPEPA